MAASNSQVQQYVNERLRVRAEQFRALYNACKDDKLSIEDVYAAVSAQNPTWTDTRPDGPPHLLTPQDVLAYNTVLFMFIALVEGTLTNDNKGDFNAQWPVLMSACVRPL